MSVVVYWVCVKCKTENQDNVNFHGPRPTCGTCGISSHYNTVWFEELDPKTCDNCQVQLEDHIPFNGKFQCPALYADEPITRNFKPKIITI